jgi:Ca2+/H+ antiporter, TMEM165/GDT1 family
MHALRLATYVFSVIFVAELPDKTALAALVLATRHKPMPVFLGAASALALQSGVAVAAGSLLSLLPRQAVHLGVAAAFLVSALLMWIRKEKDDPAPLGAEEVKPVALPFWRSLATTFGVVFLAEWGDLTQFATAAFAARERSPWLIFGAATLALWLVAAVAVALGNRAARWIHPRLMQRAAALLFLGIGIATLVGRF